MSPPPEDSQKCESTQRPRLRDPGSRLDVIGRETEQRAVESLLAHAERGPAGLVLSGAPGIGKTLLWEAAVDEARQRLDRVLTCRAVQAEAALAFTGLSELLTGVLEEVAGALPSPAGAPSRWPSSSPSRERRRPIRTRSGWHSSTRFACSRRPDPS